MQYNQIFFKNHIIRKKKYMSAIPESGFVVPFPIIPIFFMNGAFGGGGCSAASSPTKDWSWAVVF